MAICRTRAALPLAIGAALCGQSAPMLQTARIDTGPCELTYGVFDAARQRVVAFEKSGGIWEWNGQRFVRRADSDPVTLQLLNAAYDPVHQRTLLLGQGSSWDGARLHPEPSLGAHGFSPPAFDAVRNRLAVYENGFLREWNGSGWTTHAPALAPPYRSGATLVYDPANQRIVLYGADGAPTADCWSWDGSTWTLIAANAPPGPRSMVSMEYDPQNQRIVLYGGAPAPTPTWTLQGSTWSQITTLHDPDWRNRAEMVWDGSGMLLWGGNDYRAGEVWRFANNDWQVAHEQPPKMNNGAMAVDETNGEIVVFGGALTLYNYPPLQDTWTFDGAWHRRAPIALPQARYRSLMAWSILDDAVLMFGGYGSLGLFGDTWLWQNGNWVGQTPTISPSPRTYGAIATSPAGGVLLYGDGASVFDHWEWNSGNWTQMPPPPMQLVATAAAFDHLRSLTFIVGYDPANASRLVAWTWNGFQWTQLPPPPVPTTNPYSPIVAERAEAGTILVDTHSDVIEWNGAQWSTPQARLGSPLRLGVGFPQFQGAVTLGLGVTPHSLLEVYTEYPAEALRYGTGCALGRAPALSLRGPFGPSLPPAELLAVTASPAAPMAFAFGLAAPNVPLGGGCTLLLGNQLGAVFTFTDANGDGSVALSMPSNLGLLGIVLHCQAAVLDAANSNVGGLTMSEGLRLTTGR